MQVRTCKLNLFLDDAPRVDLSEWKYMLSKCLSDFMKFVMSHMRMPKQLDTFYGTLSVWGPLGPQ